MNRADLTCNCTSCDCFITDETVPEGVGYCVANPPQLLAMPQQVPAEAMLSEQLKGREVAPGTIVVAVPFFPRVDASTVCANHPDWPSSEDEGDGAPATSH